MTEEAKKNAKKHPKRGEREFETGMDEFFKAGSENMYNNMKRTYDEYMQESLETMRLMRSYVHKIWSNAEQNDQTRQNITNQALQNAVETENMVSKQAVRHMENAVETTNKDGKQATRHADIAIDRQWNVDEQGYTVNEILRGQTYKDVVSALADKILADAISKVEASK